MDFAAILWSLPFEATEAKGKGLGAAPLQHRDVLGWVLRGWLPKSPQNP